MVLVTGGTGFIGAYVIKQLIENGYSVRALKRSTSKLPFFIPAEIFEKVEWVEGDVLDIVSLEEAMNDVDSVIHSAAMISFYPGDKAEMYKVNIQGTANMVNTSLEKNISRFVHVSSVAALGRTKNNNHVTEEKKWQDSNNNTHYAISKQKSEMEVWRGIGEGLNAVIVNPSTVLGYGDWNTSSCRIFKTIYDEFPWYSTGINGFVDVEDIAKATVLLMESDITEQRFILNGDNWSFEQLFNTIADAFGKRHPKLRATPFLGNIAWRMEIIKSWLSGNKPLLTKESAKVAHSRTFFGNDKILSAIPEFSFTPLQESIQKACKKYLQAINMRQS
ncbi:MAG TPA: SDR family NAD(P)-dependent oxidoreductase [Chitinophagaceae bacterium]|jgi:nucleoside-diphosphate-sugar epimerase